MPHTLSRLTAQAIEALDCRDDRLRHLLQHVRTPASWHPSEREVHARRMAMYDLSQAVIRGDAPTVSGAHEGTAEGLIPWGQSKADPTRPQIKGMLGALDPLGMPLATAVLSGERAADGLSLPIMERRRSGWHTTGRLLVGDCPMRAWATRASLAPHQDMYVSPWPLTGATAAAREAWITEGGTQGNAGAGAQRVRTTDRGHKVLAAAG